MGTHCEENWQSHTSGDLNLGHIYMIHSTLTLLSPLNVQQLCTLKLYNKHESNHSNGKSG